MKLVKEIIYNEFVAKSISKDLETIVDKFRKNKVDSFNIFIELHEDKYVTVFANIYAFEWDTEHGRTFQIETATLDKENLTLNYHGDNNGPDGLDKLDGKPMWPTDELISIGVKKLGDAPFGYPYKSYRWQNYI